MWPLSAAHLFVFSMVLGTGHMFLMASQQMLTVRCATAWGYVAFGHFMVAISIGQGLGPFIVGWIGGGATVPATGPLFLLGGDRRGTGSGNLISELSRPAPGDTQRKRQCHHAP